MKDIKEILNKMDEFFRTAPEELIHSMNTAMTTPTSDDVTFDDYLNAFEENFR